MRRVLIAVLIVAGAFAALLALVMLAVHTPSVREHVLELVRKHVRLNYGAELTIDGIEYSLTHGTVTLEGVVLRSAGAGGLPPLLKARRVYADLDIGSALKGPIAIERAELDGVVVRAVMLSNGQSNVPQFGRGGGCEFGILVDSLDAMDVQIDYEDRRQQLALRLPAIDIRVRGRRDDLSHQVSVKTDEGGTLVYQRDEFGIKNLDLESRLLPSELKVESVRLVAANSKVRGSGAVRNLSDPVVDMTFDADIDIGEVAGGNNSFPGLQGRASGTISVKGPIKSLQIKGDLKGAVR